MFRIAPRSTASLLAAACLACGQADRPRPDHPLLVIGWDGASFDLLDPLLAQGRLPNLAALMERGGSARLESTVVPISSAAWVGAATGYGPGETGVYDFFEPVPDSYRVRLIDSRSNEKPTLWRRLDAEGLRSIVFGVPVTWPPETIDGVIVAGMLAPFEGEYAHPPGLADDLRQRGFEPDLGVWREERELSPARMKAQLALKREILLEALQGEEWDLAFLVFKSLDVLSHRTYDTNPAGPVARWCEELDAVLGELLAAAGAESNVVLLSDHGFATYPLAFSTSTWLIEEGYSQPQAKQGGTQGDGPLALTRAVEHSQRVLGLDLEQSVAFAGTGEGNFGGIHLHRAGREPQGVVAADEAPALLDEIEARLSELKLPDGQTPLVSHVWRARDLYPGPQADVLPDLLFEVDPRVKVVATPGPKSLVELPGPPLPDHARDGVLVAAGPSFARRSERGRAAIFDLAPNALHLLGLAVPVGMHGELWSDWIAHETPVRWVAASEAGALNGRWRKTTGDEDDDEVLRRLEAMGYVDGR